MELIGVVLPVFIGAINKKIADTYLRFLVSAFVCALVGIGVNYLNTEFKFVNLREGFESVSATILVVFGLAQLTYKGVWENPTVQKTIK